MLTETKWQIFAALEALLYRLLSLKKKTGTPNHNYQLLLTVDLKNISATYKGIAALSFLILTAVQFFLVYNTYMLKSKQYYSEGKDIIGNEYAKIIVNDKLYPGADAIIKKYLDGNMQKFEYLYKHNSTQFDSFSQTVLDSMCKELIAHNNIDSFMAAVTKKHHFEQTFAYALNIEQLDIAFRPNEYIPLYKKPKQYPLINPSYQTDMGLRIGGTLQQVDILNLASGFTVSSPDAYDYKINFAFFVDTPNRNWSIAQSIIPTLLLSVLSIISVVGLFFFTFRNWVKQKKLADMKSDFVNSITHEFHTPLAAIIVANKSLQNEKIVEKKENIRPLTEVIQRQSDRLKLLISQVLDLTVMNESALQKQEYHLHDLLDEILLDYRLKLTDTDVFLTLVKEAKKDSVILDKFWFTTMLLNLFENAIKYNNQEVKEITVTTKNSKKNISIHISDNGIGMTEDTLRHIFEKFYRNTKDLQHVKGLGLGLYYTRQCIDAHRWAIDIKSEPGHGSTFIIQIPLQTVDK